MGIGIAVFGVITQVEMYARGKRMVAKGATEAEKKDRERRIIEAARRHCAFFPTGKLVPDEKPDWRVPSASVGIEVSELVSAKPEGTRFSGPQISSFQQSVVAAAQELYYSTYGTPPAEVLVYFENEWSHKRDVKVMAKELATLVRSNYPSGAEESTTLGPLNGSVDGPSVVRISRDVGEWQAEGCGGVPCLTYDQTAARIEAKDVLLPEYRKHCPGWQLWLLLSTRMPVLHSLSIPHEVIAWQFNSNFDRVFLHPWDNGVIELQLHGRT